MEDLEFECDAVGCETKVARKDGLCKYHIGRYVEARKNGGPMFLRKSQGHGTPLTPALSLKGRGGSKGRGRKKTAEEAEMKCARCGKSSAVDKRFYKKRGLCNSCNVTITHYKKTGKELPPARGKTKETPASGGGTASLKEGKIYAAKKPLTPPSPSRGEERSKGRGRKKIKAAGEQISPGLPLKKEGKWEAEGILTLTLDFKGYESLLGVITSMAQDDFRTPEMQALFMIKEVLDK